MVSRAGHVLCTVTVISLIPSALNAQDRWRLDLRVDNDLFVEFSPTRSQDHEYTHGTMIGLESLSSQGPCGDRHHLALGLSQLLFTPRDETPGAEGQRRDAGWLRLQANCIGREGRSRNSAGMVIGVVGPLSGGEQAQRAVHRLLHFREPQGWDRQLPNRLEIAVWAARRFPVTPRHFPVQLWIEGRADIGTIRSSVSGATAVSLRSRRHPDTGLDLRVGASAVGNDYLLQGLTTRRVLGWASLRGSVGLHPLVLSYGLTARTRSYREEPSGFLFGSIGIGFYW